jgi:hypothetical protein
VSYLHVAEGEVLDIGPSFLCAVMPDGAGHYLPHRSGYQSNEVSAASDSVGIEGGKVKVGFVDEISWGKRGV